MQGLRGILPARKLLRELAKGRLTGDEPLVGAASIAAMLPLDDANRFTDVFARREILDRVTVPVFFGASAFNPELDLAAFMCEVADAGYLGVANFPTATHYDGSLRNALEEAGLGYAREVEMLKEARRAGLVAFGYAKTRHESRCWMPRWMSAA